MSEIIRGKTNQKGCHVCGRPIHKIGENALVLKDSDGNIAFCSSECADKYDPKVDLSAKKKVKKKKKIDDLLMAPTKLAEVKPVKKAPAKTEKVVKKTAKPKTASTKKTATKKTTKPKTASTKAKPKPKKK